MVRETTKLLGASVKPGDKYLHPITLEIITNTSKIDIYPGDIRKINNNIHRSRSSKTHDKLSILSANEIQKYMALPYVNLNVDIMLSIYKITTIDTLINWVNTMIKEKKSFSYVNRIINIWNKVNYINIVDNNNILIILYKIINEHYWKIEIDDDNLKKYIHLWFKTKNINDFMFDLGLDIVKNLNSNK